ncbi:histone-lysine N-methyltransferase SETD1B-like [Senna tora]|uniref:Histone-lysine N-methyltransferase SETD1B-like n=1 Tax=Senna tora TaxID=362788 RepID=A0A835CAR9_9FABA|nr:histone-lysine N-methyltransferase SETD1B-like [Senna tora]
MEAERPHHHNSTSELFICFTSRLSSSSSMKLSSKSLLSPSRNREPSQISLSSSLSRRLRSNGSIKGGNGQASPMFPATNGKKRGCAFENPEPSSPKVTCIGQVRVKTKKQGKKMRAVARSKKRRGEASFRRTEQGGFSSDLQNLQQEAGLTHRNQRWVHLPLTICEALRAFGAEFSCLFPCRSSSCGREKEEEERVEKGEGSGGGESREGSCGAAFARWLVALQEGDGKGREIELVVGEQNEHGVEEEQEEEDSDGDGRRDRPERSRRRHVFEDIEIDVEKKNEEGEEEEEKGRVSICIPPKNALLLMRCRSDPVKMAALANRFWESPAHKDEVEENEHGEEEEDNDEEEEEQQEVHMEEDEQVQVQVQLPKVEVEQDGSICERGNEEQEVSEAKAKIETKSEVEEAHEAEAEATPNPEINEEKERTEEEEEEEEEDEGGNAIANQKDETLVSISSPEVTSDPEKSELLDVQEEKLESEDYSIEAKSSEHESSSSSSSPVISEASESENNEEESAVVSVKAETFAEEEEEATEESTEGEEEEEKETGERPGEDETTATQDRSEPDGPKLPEKKPGPVLPDCLLLMMCEPKLSMEVSKETWVCSTDFIRWLPDRPAKRKDGGDEPKKRISVDSKPPQPPVPAAAQPPRSSCSFPAPATHGAGMSMATMIEQKLVGSNGYEPFVLTRCKSEPMRSSAKLGQDACFWKNRKLEPHHHPATLGVGAAGIIAQRLDVTAFRIDCKFVSDFHFSGKYCSTALLLFLFLRHVKKTKEGGVIVCHFG